MCFYGLYVNIWYEHMHFYQLFKIVDKIKNVHTKYLEKNDKNTTKI